MEELPSISRLEQIKIDLSEMSRQDEQMRSRHLSGGGEWDSSVDTRNTEGLKAIVDEIGWPTIPIVGAEASQQAWLLAQHADHDPEFQSRCLGLMKEWGTEDVAQRNIAYLEDRVRIGGDRPQVYGTQFRMGNSGNFEPLPIENPDKVDERRLRMGLDSLESNLERMRKMYGARKIV